MLRVEDDGRASPAGLRDRVFERFVRSDDDDAGSGLGLAICRAIARAHGGDVVLEDRSRFVARLPRLDLKKSERPARRRFSRDSRGADDRCVRIDSLLLVSLLPRRLHGRVPRRRDVRPRRP